LLGDAEDSYSLDNIQSLVLKKYQANLLAGRRDSAIAISTLLCDSLTGAFQRAKEVDAAEQAVIVSKVEELGDQQVAATRRHQLEMLGLIGLLFLLILGYILYRRYHHHQLRKAHDELREDYGELEAATTERSRQETEQRIAAAIQQYIAHEPLPQRNDLTVLVSQIPGTMPGDSFSDSILNGDILTFCIGSATGKGVEAATAAAMAWAQFRTAAAFESAPERIVTAISEAIADGKNMPVRLFVGAYNQATGELEYCNAGNNTPLLADDELTMLPADDSEPAGTQPGYAYTAQQATIAKGKLLFLYTDTVAQATDANGKTLGDKHLRGMALQAYKTDARPEPFFKNIQKAIADFSAGAPQADDVTLMVIGRK